MTDERPASERPAADRGASPASLNIEPIHRTLSAIGRSLDVDVPELAASAPTAKATIVVVGEPKGGKSTLINALVGRPGLSPVDYAVSTATYLAIRHGAPKALVIPDGETVAEEVHLDELPLWTSVEGLASNPRASRSPQPVELSLPAPLLEHLDLIDTPGVGGFDARHDEATLTALSGATSLLFCVDGSRPISGPELEFLERATTSIAHVTFVLTKVDQHLSYAEVMEDDRAKIADHAAVFASARWFPVAAPLAERSLDPGLPEGAQLALRERSGLDALVAYLVGEVADRAKALAVANDLRSLRSTAVNLRSIAVGRLDLLDDPSGRTLERLAGEQTDMERLSSIEDEWRTELERRLNELRSTEMNRLDRTVREIQDVGLPLAQDVNVPPERVTSTVNEMLVEESTAVAQRIVSNINSAIREIVGDAITSAAFALALERAERSGEGIALREARDLVAEGRLQPAQRMPLLMTGTSGLMLANVTGLAGPGGAAAAAASSGLFSASMLGALLPGVGIGIAATAAAVMFARRQSKVNERSQWVQTRLVESKVDLQTVIDQRITAARSVAQRAVREWIRGRQSELRSSINELTAQAKRDVAEQKQAVQAARARVDELDKITRTCDTHVARLVSAATAEPS